MAAVFSQSESLRTPQVHDYEYNEGGKYDKYVRQQ